MKPIGGMALIDLIVERVKQSDHYNHKTQNLMIATTVEAEDDLLAHYCLSKGYKVFRGSEADVLQRFAQIVRHFEPQIIVRLTGDNPFIDPVLLSKMLEKHRQEKADYTYTAGTPLGISGEMIDAQILSEIDNFPLRSQSVSMSRSISESILSNFTCNYSHRPKNLHILLIDSRLIQKKIMCLRPVY
ncbi:hypothetical protein BsIDN1_66470 [Bacillus safensis]|uniref:MobA-like NTP transferase domain-containing protein n=1 Tax=Bacillus safensis TaxID=561879 RepID=A0A5S9MM25_BACIA|nr:hypothetical protein BsIDN1_66470 [Bacillus safensis]